MRAPLAMVLLVFTLAACGGSNDAPETSGAEGVSTEALTVEAPSTDTQIVQVTVEGSTYLFSPASVQVGKSVRLVFDPDGLPGCSRDLTLPAYHITKTITAGDATIEFTPEVAGPIALACTMNMYRGTLTAQ